MQGRRLADLTTFKLTHIMPGDYVKYTDEDGEVTWFCYPPGGALGNLGAHTVVEHEDATITVSPSILIEGEWHGYLEHGVWREC